MSAAGGGSNGLQGHSARVEQLGSAFWGKKEKPRRISKCQKVKIRAAQHQQVKVKCTERVSSKAAAAVAVILDESITLTTASNKRQLAPALAAAVASSSTSSSP